MKLIICEKPDQARQVAEALGGFSKSGMSWTGKFEGEIAAIVACRGHLYRLLEPQEAKPDITWNDPKTLTPVPMEFKMKAVKDNPEFKGSQISDYIKTIGKHIGRATEVIIATDADREGEAIGWEVVQQLGYSGDVRRAWFSGGTDLDSYRTAMKKLYPASRTKSWSRASEARGRSDWFYQFLVRAYTYYASYSALGGNLGRGEDARSRVVSVGRVQLPVVRMVHDRDEEIRTFVSVDHFKIKGIFTTINIDANYYPEVTRSIIDSEPDGVHWEPSKVVVEDGKEAPLDRPLFIDRDKVNNFKERLMASDEFVIESFSSRKKEKHPPKAFSLMSAQREISKKFPNLDSEGLQMIVEDLYEQGWISYPRTEHEEIPLSFYDKGELVPLLKNLSNVPQLKEMAELAEQVHGGKHQTYKKFVPKGFSKKEMEHHGLLPTKQAMDGYKFSNLNAAKSGSKATPEMMKFSYLAIAKQYLQMMLPPATIAEQKVDFSAPVEDLLGNKRSLFKAKAEQVVDQGWMVFSTSNKKDNEALALKKGDSVGINGVELASSKTQPPPAYSEIGLSDAMSNIGKNISDPKLKALLKHASGLGTPATRSTVIKTVKARGYLEVKGKNIHCTGKGADLLKVVPSKMTSAEMTAVWEDYLMQIQEEKDDKKAISMRDNFVMKQKNAIEKLISDLETTYRPKMGEKVAGFSKKGQKPTDAMINFAKKLSENSEGKLKIPRGLKSDFDVCKKFLDEHGKSSGNSDGKPSASQINFAGKIWDSLSDKVQSTIDKHAVFADRKAISEFINKNQSSAKRSPSEAQANFAKKISARLKGEIKEPNDLYTDAIVCSKYISKYKDHGFKKGK
jgi:DNA topoisomerase IA